MESLGLLFFYLLGFVAFLLVVGTLLKLLHFSFIVAGEIWWKKHHKHGEELGNLGTLSRTGGGDTPWSNLK